MVRFDDRLQTVLRQPASDRHDAAVRWRQLVDLIARAGPAADSDGINAALAVIRADAPRLDEPLRAAAARAIAALPLPLGLLECFIADGLAVSAPILAAASLETEQWTTLLAGADPETRRFVEALHPELAERPMELTERLISHPPDEHRRTSIGEVIERIERRRQREPRVPTKDFGQLPAADHSVFRWECGPSGDIGWVEGAPRGSLIGRSIARIRDDNGDRIDQAALRAFAQRAPFRDSRLVLAGESAVSGEWRISGTPAFDSVDGRFAGFRGIALRHSAHERRAGEERFAPDGDSLRDLVHEIKTPLNAIIGFAEIIDGQYLGPAGRRYRERAAAIVAHARLLLDAIDDLDLVARAPAAGGSADLVGILIAAVGELKSGIALAPSRQPVVAALDSQSATRLVKRLLEAALALADSGETLRAEASRSGVKAIVSVTREGASAGSWETVVAASREGLDEQTGRFSLRLLSGLARIAGGEISLAREVLTLAIPAA